MSRRPSDEEIEEVTKALRVIFEILMLDGNDFMEGRLFADGRLFAVNIKITEIIE